MSKTFKALQRAAEERASKLGGTSPEDTTPPDIDNDDTVAEEVIHPKYLIELETLKVLREEAAEALRKSELIRKEAGIDAQRAAMESRQAFADREIATRESQRAAESEKAAKEAERAMAESEESAREAVRKIEIEKKAQETARAAAEMERGALEAIKVAVAQERAAQSAARESLEMERAALENLRAAVAKNFAQIESQESSLGTSSPPVHQSSSETRGPELSKESTLVESSEIESPSTEAPEKITDESSDPLAALPPLDDRIPDPALQKLLISEFSDSSSARPAKVGPFGRVVGSLDPDRAGALLKRYALLHCVKEGRDVTLWFWGNGKEAREYSISRGLPLDEDALS